MLTHHRNHIVSRSRVEKGQIAKQYASGSPQDLSASLIHGSSDHRKRTEQPMELLDKFVGYRIFSYRELIGNKRIRVGADIAYLVFHRLYTLDISTWIADGKNRGRSRCPCLRSPDSQFWICILEGIGSQK